MKYIANYQLWVMALAILTIAAKKPTKQASLTSYEENTVQNDPVSVQAKLVGTDDASVKTLVITANIMDGYHIYAYVSPEDPYIQSKPGFELPTGATAIGDWENSAAKPYPGNGTLFVYTKNVEFKQRIKFNSSQGKGTKLKCWLYYQCCDANVCFPPKQQNIEIEITP